MSDATRLLLLGLLSEHIVRLGRDLKRPDLTPSGRAKYEKFLEDAILARDEIAAEEFA